MRKLVIAIAALAAVGVAVPASISAAQAREGVEGVVGMHRHHDFDRGRHVDRGDRGRHLGWYKHPRHHDAGISINVR
jgi:hypothetical protein